MFNVSYIVIGVVVIIFIISLALFIFAPKSINYFDSDTYPILMSINDNHIDILKADLTKIKDLSCETNEPNTNEPAMWRNWPDKEHVVGDYKIYPMCMLETESSVRIDNCPASYNLIKYTPNVQSCAFIKLGPKSTLNKHKQWKELANNTLRALFILEAPKITSPEQCCIWVNGEIRELKPNKLIIYDASKEHSIYNKTKKIIYMLLIDIIRPDQIPTGVSDRDDSDEFKLFIKNLSEISDNGK